jgi:hypothetical protein
LPTWCVLSAAYPCVDKLRTHALTMSALVHCLSAQQANASAIRDCQSDSSKAVLEPDDLSLHMQLCTRIFADVHPATLWLLKQCTLHLHSSNTSFAAVKAAATSSAAPRFETDAQDSVNARKNCIVCCPAAAPAPLQVRIFTPYIRQCRAGLAMLTLGLLPLPMLPPLPASPTLASDTLSLKHDPGLTPTPPAAAPVGAPPPDPPLTRTGLGPGEPGANTGLLARTAPLASAPPAPAAVLPCPEGCCAFKLLLLGSGLRPPPPSALLPPAGVGADPVTLRAWPSSTCAALLAKFRELRLSLQDVASGDRLHTSSTLLLPHKLSCRTCSI